MSKETTGVDVANWYFLSFVTMFACLRGLFDYNLLTDLFGWTGGLLTVAYITFGVSSLFNLHSLMTEGP
jgi:uncharacterized membrane protein YuzA (DUF378 family)